MAAIFPIQQYCITMMTIWYSPSLQWTGVFFLCAQENLSVVVTGSYMGNYNNYIPLFITPVRVTYFHGRLPYEIVILV